MCRFWVIDKTEWVSKNAQKLRYIGIIDFHTIMNITMSFGYGAEITLMVQVVLYGFH